MKAGDRVYYVSVERDRDGDNPNIVVRQGTVVETRRTLVGPEQPAVKWDDDSGYIDPSGVCNPSLAGAFQDAIATSRGIVEYHRKFLLTAQLDITLLATAMLTCDGGKE